MTHQRLATITRQTLETSIYLSLNLDGTGQADVETGIGFLDHLLTTWARHANFDLELKADGDLVVDDHHTIEDCGLALGAAVNEALGERRGIMRFGSAYVPLDESLSRAVVDLSGRPFAVVNLGLSRERLGTASTENIAHLVQSFAMSCRAAIHLDVLRGENDHHRAESAFKAFAIALRNAVALDGSNVVRSTKGSL